MLSVSVHILFVYAVNNLEALGYARMFDNIAMNMLTTIFGTGFSMIEYLLPWLKFPVVNEVFDLLFEAILVFESQFIAYKSDRPLWLSFQIYCSSNLLNRRLFRSTSQADGIFLLNTVFQTYVLK